MKIISHRGFWRDPVEKNSEIAFSRSFSLGFGVETDVRDAKGSLVISHDMPKGGELSFDNLLEMAAAVIGSTPITIAVNVKADGLSRALSEKFVEFDQLDCFVFDMASPDMRSYFDAGIPVFTRMSEHEMAPVWLDRAAGVWLDAFDSEWYTPSVIEKLASRNKRVCIVSPELHGRSHLSLWESLRDLKINDVMLCTDYPMAAQQFFS